MEYDLLNLFIKKGKEARLFLLIATFLWTAIYIGPHNIYFFVIAIGVSSRGLFNLYNFFQLNKKIDVHIKSIKKYHSNNFDEQEIKKYSFKFNSFFSDGILQFGIIISVYPIALIGHYAENNNLDTLLSIIGVVLALLLMALLGMGTQDMESFTKQ